VKLETSKTRLTALIALILGVSFFIQFPSTQAADWQLFSFYDPGTTIKGDILLAKNYVPTIDFGYTHGLIPLAFGRAVFAVFGRTPFTYLGVTFFLELLMAGALARILIALKLPRRSIFIFLAALPIAIMPAYLTFTHPLEALLLLMALADHAEGKRHNALATLALCIFVKPSMAYVYGLFLTIVILTRRADVWAVRVRNFVPAILTFFVAFGGLALLYGVAPVLHTLLPLTGAKTYAATNFGFFTPSGRAFWWTPHLIDYVCSPVGIWLIAVLGSLGIALALLTPKSWRGILPSWMNARIFAHAMRSEILLTVVGLHGAFLIGFYGWTGSWTYYSYMPMLALAILVALFPLHRVVFAAILGLTLLGHTQHLQWSINDWRTKPRTDDGLFVYSDKLEEWNKFRGLVAGRPTLLMTHGYIPNLPANIQLPDAWFPEPGIPTPAEIRRVQKQIEEAECIIQWKQYGTLDLLHSPDFTKYRPLFRVAQTGDSMTLLERIEPSTQTR